MAISGVGTVFKRSDMASSPAFTAIAEINSIDGPTMSKNTIDITSLDSTGGYREFTTGFRDGGTMVLNMNFTRTTYEDMLTDFNSDTVRDYQLVLPDSGNTTFDLSGLVTELPLNIPTDDKITANVTIKISGEVTLQT